MDAGALGGLCGRCWGQVLAIDQRLAEAGYEQQEHRPVQAVTGADLGKAVLTLQPPDHRSQGQGRQVPGRSHEGSIVPGVAGVGQKKAGSHPCFISLGAITLLYCETIPGANQEAEKSAMGKKF
jgi:hypothetical protein